MEMARAITSMANPYLLPMIQPDTLSGIPTASGRAPEPRRVQHEEGQRPSRPPGRRSPSNRPSAPPPSGEVTLGSLTAAAPTMRNVLGILARVAPTELTITLIGETGTGKDVLAHAVHDCSLRSSGTFAVFDCGAVAPNLAESELFGHEKGAFTGAHSAYEGAFERANGGTLFLDEVGELPL